MSCVCAMKRWGRSEWRGVSTLGSGSRSGAEHRCAHRAHHLAVRDAVLRTKHSQAVYIKVREGRVSGGPEIGAASLTTSAGTLAKQVGRLNLERRVAAARLHERRIAPDHVREIHELLELAASRVRITPEILHGGSQYRQRKRGIVCRVDRLAIT